MPTRILRDWTDSDKFDGITADAERLFARLIMKADDYGRFHAEPRRLKAALFPLLETLRTNDLVRWLDELSRRQLILRYEVENRQLLAIPRFGQRLKMSRAKFPPLPGEQDDWLPDDAHFREVPGSSGKFPPESESDSDNDSEGKRGGKALSRLARAKVALPEWQEYARSLKPPFPDAGSEEAWDHYEKVGWRSKQGPIADWKAACRTAAANFRKWGAESSKGRRPTNTPDQLPTPETKLTPEELRF